jgi:hypothetical protein
MKNKKSAPFLGFRHSFGVLGHAGYPGDWVVVVIVVVCGRSL